jgi:hypothetical protein
MQDFSCTHLSRLIWLFYCSSLNVKWPQMLKENHYIKEHNNTGTCKTNNKNKTCRKKSMKIFGEVNWIGNYYGSGESNKNTRTFGLIVQQKDIAEWNGGALRKQTVSKEEKLSWQGFQCGCIGTGIQGKLQKFGILSLVFIWIYDWSILQQKKKKNVNARKTMSQTDSQKYERTLNTTLHIYRNITNLAYWIQICAE